MCTYHKVAKVVEPKIEALRAAEAQLKIATKEKDAALGELLVVQSKLDTMQVRHCSYLPPALQSLTKEQPMIIL